ncbi:MAG: hypothetical protein K2X62_02830 [Beijerinckiaceae bacterium]|nr:hypothetical protein [Beijerinckiaceae bacterium]MDO9441938.1 hypothetical protein [Beijerinckiaceae bacterium]
MTRLAFLMFGLVSSVLAGVGIVAILATPSWSSQAMSLIPIAVAVAAVLGAPISFLVARSILANGRPRA